ncbi:metallophosphoesterase [Aurantibacter aestuarii]|uniref:Phosphoesterase n=1 Tax=Aurantibacter aestuarii TaxID=1266046 RepID=A0A2T1NDY3_9FLAO|nr:metallophosphoesterase [Aurantibacter aestuarii]PSG90661.1 phosphoesterase [Aurantibacter aestuarii]
MRKNNIILTLLAVFLFSACATYKEQYKDEDNKIENLPTDKPIQTFYLIGDAGKSPVNGMSKGLTILDEHIKDKSTKKDYMIFLGDNIYPAGLPKKDEAGRDNAVNALEGQIKATKNFKGEVVFIPGNHDWYSNGLQGLDREEDYIDDALGKNTFQPEKGCPLVSLDVSKDVQLIIIDSQWYLEDWNEHPTINDECEIKTRDRFFEELEGELKKAQNKTVLFAMHHPMKTNGVHGGFYAAKKHLYPLQKKIPMPILASLVTQIRTQGGVSIQDRYNERYNELMNRIETMALEYNNVVFASGHEHTLQYIEEEGIKQIVSGSGAKESFAALSNNGLFSSGKQGFVEFNIYKNGEAFVSYYAEVAGKKELLFQKKVLESRKTFDLSTLNDTFPQKIEASVYTKSETDKSSVYESLLGDRYREMYSKKITVPVATLDTLYGGLEIVRKGGGHQTRSLRLKTKDGRELNMRALRKSATQYLQTVVFKENYIEDQFTQTKVEDLVLDFYTAAHPYAFLAIPDLSDAAKVYHTNPKLYYIPKHKYLGEYNAEYGGELYMIEERPEENYTNERNFGYADDIESTHDIIEKIREDEKYKIDENSYIRARLFDMLIGDWDRHQDQWRWAQFDQKNGDKLFKPIPRDRDQVFANFDGALLDILRVISGSTKQLQVYDGELKDIKWMNSAGIKLDKVLIQQSEKDAWLKQAKFLQENVTDEVIETAFSKLPEGAQDKNIDEIKGYLKERRSNMIDIASRYYNYLNELVIVTGTDKDDYFEITRSGNKETNIKIFRIKDGKKADTLLNRTFNKEITKEIWVYGLDDDDVFEVKGNAKNPIFTRIIGGQNNDIYKIKNGKRTRVYDHKSKPNTIEESKGGQIVLTDIYNNNLFDFNKGIVKTNVIAPSVGFNPDDGVKLGIFNTYTVKGFKRNPYSQQHKFNAGYFFATQGFSINYDGEFANIIKDWNFHIGGKITSANFTNNFFGFGNETENPLNFDDDLDFDFNRVKMSIYHLSLGFVRKGDFGSDFGLKVFGEGIQIEDTNDRFINLVEPDNDSELYERRYFAGAEANFLYAGYDSKINPTRGMFFELEIGGKTEPERTEGTYGYLNSDLTFYNALVTNRKLVLKTKLNTQIRVGNEYLFYQAANIGGNNGLRGFRTERFTGQYGLVGNADVRYSFEPLKTKTLPLQFGVFAGGDVGRVWVRSEESDKWHNSYGGGFWVTAAESLSGTFNLFNSVDGLRFSFGFGVNF